MEKYLVIVTDVYCESFSEFVIELVRDKNKEPSRDKYKVKRDKIQPRTIGRYNKSDETGEDKLKEKLNKKLKDKDGMVIVKEEKLEKKVEH